MSISNDKDIKVTTKCGHYGNSINNELREKMFEDAQESLSRRFAVQAIHSDTIRENKE